MKKEDHKTESHSFFRETWRLLYSNPRMFNYYLKDNRLSIHERRLLKCLQHYKNNKKAECLDLLSTNIPDDSVLEGVRLYIKGLVYNQHGHFHYAIENLENAIKLFKDNNEKTLLLSSYYLLALVLINRREVSKLEQLLDELDEYPPMTMNQKVQFQYTKLAYFVLTNQKIKAITTYKRSLQLIKSDAHISEYPYFLVQIFTLHSINEEYNHCYSILEEYKQLSGNMVKANYLFMKTLLDHITKDAPLYVYAKDFGDFPELYQQLLVIRSLREGDLSTAKNNWELLRQHNPDLYGENYQYQNDHSLFAQALKRYLVSNDQNHSIDQRQLKSISSLFQKLEYILTQSPYPVPIADLIQYLWNEEYTEASFSRLRSLISRYNRQSPHKITSIRGSYSIKSYSKAG